jgi:hypothetical protein
MAASEATPWSITVAESQADQAFRIDLSVSGGRGARLDRSFRIESVDCPHSETLLAEVIQR